MALPRARPPAPLARACPNARPPAPFALAFLALAGCSSTPLAEPTYAAHKTAPGVWLEVATPPPPAPPESVSSAPSERHVWVDGQWVYQRVTGKWTWEQGAWCVPPADARFYARPALMRVRHVLGRATRWNTFEGRYEEVDVADDRWTWAKGRFYTGPTNARAAPSDEKGQCSAPSAG
jgi:hypothetical protein